MSHRLLGDASFHGQLLEIDADLAAQAKTGGCRVCGGKLHAANYGRKPRGCPRDVESEFGWRHSFCCEAEDCRRRLTPVSVRFLDGRVYTSVVVVVAAVLAHGLSGTRLRKLRAELGVDRRTLERWRSWWQETVPETGFWTELRGRLDHPVEERSLPHSLLARMQGGAADDRLLSLLRLIDPLSHSALMRARFSRAA